LDGHIVLSRQLADSGHYPAIDIGSSVSRVMSTVIDKPHFQQAQRLKQLYSAYIQNQDLIKMGMYQRGSDQTLDEAILFHSKIKLFLQQATDESSAFEATLSTLMGLFE
jgi:flagellum-specific ATP synthase